jgi:hypothetical protein
MMDRAEAMRAGARSDTRKSAYKCAMLSNGHTDAPLAFVRHEAWPSVAKSRPAS